MTYEFGATMWSLWLWLTSWQWSVEYSKPEPEAAKKEAGDGLPNLDQDELQDVPELEDDHSEEDTEPEYP